MIAPCGGPITISSCPQEIKVECTCNPAENPCVSEIRDFLQSHIGWEVTIYTNNSSPNNNDITGIIDTVQTGTVTITITGQGSNKGNTAIFSICKINEVVLVNPPAPS